jgi:general secretion pathway protein D
MIMIKPPSAISSLLLGALVVTSANAGTVETTTRVERTTTVQSAAEREVARRQEYYSRAKEAIARGDVAMKEKDYEVAVAQFRSAVDLLPESETTHELRKEALHKFCEASVRLAEQRIAEGRYADAENTVKLVLDERYDPHCKEAVVLLAHLEDPEYYNKTITPKFRANVEEVKKMFTEAEGFYATGRYDLAFKRYEQILNIDPYNIAARKGQERVNLARSNYAVEAYNETRSRAIWQVDNAWQNPVRRYGAARDGIYETSKQSVRDTTAITNKLNRIIIPRIEFRDATVREAIDFLKQKSRDLDTTEPDPSRRGVNIVLKLEPSTSITTTPAVPAPAAPGIPGLEAEPAPAIPATTTVASVNPADARITLSLSNIPLMEALRYITNQANLKVKIDPYAVAVVPLSEPTDILVTKEYRVPPGFISSAAAAGGQSVLSAPAAAVGAGGGGGDARGTGNLLAQRLPAKEFLEGNGVTFPPGASANYLPTSSRLVVRNTQENLDLIDTLVEVSQTIVPSQVEIEAKFVEITQNNLKELSFDWLLGQFNVPGSTSVFAGGGTSGNTRTGSSADFPFVPPGGTPVGGNPLTGGNRSGSTAISANAIDALLFGGNAASALAPGVLGIAGVFTDPQFQLVIRAINQKKGVDLLSAPRVTTKSGQRAVIEIIRELRYPTEFEPPEIPNEFFGGSTFTSNPATGFFGGSSNNAFPVTPTTPTAFETRNTGVTLEVEPVVGPDGFTIDLNLVPQVVEFEGFINYGSPIKTSQTNLLGVVQEVVLTENAINQPVFSTRKITTSVSVWDGQTVVLGGLMREDIQKVEDKVPLLGDIPFLGRAFRSSVDQHLKRNLVIFVTARLINPAGEPILQDEEKEEVVVPITPIEPPPLPEGPVFLK